MRLALPLLVVGFLGACSIAPRAVSPPTPPVSYGELGQDVPDDKSAVAPPVVIRCADLLHQNLPGGSDYNGPAVPECGRAY